MKRTIIESPYAGDTETHIEYAQRCVRDSLQRGEAPFASHLLYTQKHVLDDADPVQRQWGIEAGLAWGDVADLVAVYADYGLTSGMIFGIQTHLRHGRSIEIRFLEEANGSTNSTPAKYKKYI